MPIRLLNKGLYNVLHISTSTITITTVFLDK
jgi:hypothetical protein